jgi:hypothetical protein
MLRYKQRSEFSGGRKEIPKQKKRGSFVDYRRGFFVGWRKKPEEIKEVKGLALWLSHVPANSLGSCR